MNEDIENLECVEKFLEKRKAERTVLSAEDNLKQIVCVLGELNKYLAQGKKIEIEQIQRISDCLIAENTLTFDLELPEGIKIKRGRPVGVELVESVRNLSYRKRDEEALQGRYNRKGQSLFYGVIHVKPNAGVNIVFSEIEVKEGDFVCILNSKTVKPLVCRALGIFENVRKGHKPWYISDRVWAYFKRVWKLYKHHSHEADFAAFLSVEKFLYDALTKRALKRIDDTNRVYNFGNTVANILLEDMKVDGLVYNSTYDLWTPNIVLEKYTVDDKLKHIDAEAFIINKKNHNNIYYATKTHIGEILPNSEIIWREESPSNEP